MIRHWNLLNKSERHGIKGVDILPSSLMECPNNTPNLLDYKHFVNLITDCE